ncbi:hypothetical protein ABE427_02350 [Acinetobacter higginsii]|uniref:hypothetical protein n=1 Tax=Acinetobacter higginsii TaxID=70347 RepID=UPI0032092E5C
MDIKQLIRQEVKQPTYEKLYMSSVEIDNRRIVSIKLDPETIALLVEIGKEILIGLGVKVLSKILGGDGGIDLKALLKKLLDEIFSTVKLALDQNEVKLAQDKLNAVNLLLREYQNSPESSLFRLQDSIVLSAVANETLLRLQPLSTSGYILGVITRLAALQEMANISGNESEHKNVGQYASEALPSLEEGFEQLFNINNNRIGQISTYIEHKLLPDVLIAPQQQHIEREPIGPKYWITLVTMTYNADGVIRSFVEQENGSTSGDRLKEKLLPQVMASREADIKRVQDNFMSEVGIPLLEAIQTIHEIALKFK